MALKTLGHVTVTTAGTPVQASSTGITTHAVMIQQIAAQTGAMHVGISSSMDPATGTDMIGSLSIPTTNQLPSLSMGVSYAPGGIDLQEIWIDSDVNGEAVLVSYIEA